MSKRKNRQSAPNLPQDALERARRQIAEERGEIVEPVEPAPEPVVEEKPKPAPKPSPMRPITGTRASSRPEPAVISAGRVSRRRARMDDDQPERGGAEQFDMDAVRYRLHHPTRQVSVEELRQQYSYVAQDLRQIALLSAGLIIVLILIAQFL